LPNILKYQYFETCEKDTLEVGKLADVVLLDANPLKVKIDAVKDFIVLETIKNGSIVFKKKRMIEDTNFKK
jgi:predicted amidohydrolase YtcJ